VKPGYEHWRASGSSTYVRDDGIQAEWMPMAEDDAHPDRMAWEVRRGWAKRIGVVWVPIEPDMYPAFDQIDARWPRHADAG